MAVRRHHPPRTAPPRSLRWLVVCVVASIVLLIVLPVIMVIDRQGLVETILRDSPDLAPEHLPGVVIGALAMSIGVHLAGVGLLIWLTPRVLAGRRWARIVLTLYLVLATGFSLDSATRGTLYLWVVIPTDLLHLTMILLLWVPPSVRSHFATR